MLLLGSWGLPGARLLLMWRGGSFTAWGGGSVSLCFKTDTDRCCYDWGSDLPKPGFSHLRKESGVLLGKNGSLPGAP